MTAALGYNVDIKDTLGVGGFVLPLCFYPS